MIRRTSPAVEGGAEGGSGEGSDEGASAGVTAYHHGNLRSALVDAATLAARSGGPEALVLRTLAREVGVSHNAAYRHFADRTALVEEVAGRGLVELVSAMQGRFDEVEASEPEAEPTRRARLRLRATGRGYVDFAVSEPGLFRTVFTAYPELPSAEERQDHPDPFAVLNAALDDLVAVGYLTPEGRAGAEITCWAAVHGLAVLCTEGPLQGLPAELREASVEQLLVTLDRSYGATDSPFVPL